MDIWLLVSFLKDSKQFGELEGYKSCKARLFLNKNVHAGHVRGFILWNVLTIKKNKCACIWKCGRNFFASLSWYVLRLLVKLIALWEKKKSPAKIFNSIFYECTCVKCNSYFCFSNMFCLFSFSKFSWKPKLIRWSFVLFSLKIFCCLCYLYLIAFVILLLMKLKVNIFNCVK